MLPPTVAGKAAIGKEEVTRKAESAEALMQAFATTHNVPTGRLSLAVIKAAACALSAQGRGKAGVNVSAAKPAAGITIKPAVAPPGKDEVTLALSVAKQARTGLRQNIIITGVMRTCRETIARYASAIAIQVIAAQ